MNEVLLVDWVARLGPWLSPFVRIQQEGVSFKKGAERG